MALRIAVLLTLLASGRELVWQAWPAELAGDVQMVMEWPLIAALCFCLALVARNPIVTVACTFVALTVSTSSICSLAWLIHPWTPAPGEQMCSAKWGIPVTMISAFAAGLVAHVLARRLDQCQQ